MSVFLSDFYIPLRSTKSLNFFEKIFARLRYTLEDNRPSQTPKHQLSFVEIFNRIKAKKYI